MKAQYMDGARTEIVKFRATKEVTGSRSLKDKNTSP